MSQPTARFHWVVPPKVPIPSELSRAGEARGLSSRLLGILAGRGHDSEAALRALFDAPEDSLHDPSLLPDAEAFLARVGWARERAERVLVFGDFDADGLTGLAILVRALRALGIDAAPYVPDRALEGHGLSMLAIDRCVEDGRTLILTVDCGTSDAVMIAAAAGRGIDVLVTDHHRPPSRLPAAAAIVNPHLPGSRYPFAGLAGSGVAFKLAQLLLEGVPGGSGIALTLADFAAIGSVADVVPLVGENRAIVRIGLERLRTDPRPAFVALLRHAGIRPERVDLDSIGYGIAPRLNAVGRVGDPGAAVDLLLTDDEALAEARAADLHSANLVRRDLTAGALVEARGELAGFAGPAAVILGDWPVGIIGLVAGRIAEDLGLPAVVVSRATHLWRGSARAPAGFDLARAFVACDDLLERHGGHAAAAGFELLPERYRELRQRFLALAGAAPRDRRRSLDIDLVIDAPAVDYGLYRDLQRLEGTGDAPPLIGISGLVVSRLRVTTGAHLQITLGRGRSGGEVLDGIAFGRADELSGWLREGSPVDVVARLGSRTFGGFESLQLEILDAAPVGRLAEPALAA